MLLILTRNQYSWMGSSPSSNVPLPLDPNEGVKIAIACVIALILLSTQIMAFKTAKSALKRCISAGLAILAMLAWWQFLAT
jgi:hypothetical protein